MWVSKEFNFCYGHILPGHPGKCKNLHGHNGKMVVSVAGYPNASGMVIDFGDLKKFVNEEIIDKLDHAFVVSNATPEWITKNLKTENMKVYKLNYEQSTAENLAAEIHAKISDWWVGSVKIEFWETPSSYVTVEDIYGY